MTTGTVYICFLKAHHNNSEEGIFLLFKLDCNYLAWPVRGNTFLIKTCDDIETCSMCRTMEVVLQDMCCHMF